jgi:hypothetical protein
VCAQFYVCYVLCIMFHVLDTSTFEIQTIDQLPAT